MTQYASLIRDVEQRVGPCGETEREWFDKWRDEFDAVAAEGDEEACELLADILVAFDRWQRDPDEHGRGCT